MPTIAERILSKRIRPTTKGSEEILRMWPQRIREQAMFSARTTEETYLRKLQEVCAKVAAGEYNEATGRMHLTEELSDMGVLPSEGDNETRGATADKTSIARMNLVMRVQRQTGQSMGQIARSEAPEVMEAFPAYELTRGAYRKEPREDWPKRWSAAAQSVGWSGVARGTDRMVALKTSPVWGALGRGEGGFRDTLGNPYPPFAWGSALIWFDIDAVEAAELGLVRNAE